MILANLLLTLPLVAAPAPSMGSALGNGAVASVPSTPWVAPDKAGSVTGSSGGKSRNHTRITRKLSAVARIRFLF